VAADTIIYAGAFVCCDVSGFAVPAADDATYTSVVGVAEKDADNTDGAGGAIDVRIGRGVYMIRDNDPANPISGDLRNRVVYALDDEFPSASSGADRPILGILNESWFDGFEIDIGEGATGGAGGGITNISGTALLPSPACESDANTGLYPNAADSLGLTAGGELRMTIDDRVISDLEPHQTVNVRYGSRLYPPGLDGNNESTSIYCKIDPGALDHEWAMYGEITNAQLDGTNGGFIRCNHCGAGDAIFVTMFPQGGLGGVLESVGYEASTYGNGTRGFIGTVQSNPGTGVPYALPNSSHFIGYWGSHVLPNYGQVYLQESPGHAILIQKLDAFGQQAQDGNVQIRISENDFSRNRYAVHNNGTIHIASDVASAGTTTVSGPVYHSRGAYWNGAASVDFDGTFNVVVDTVAPTGHLQFACGPASAPTIIGTWSAAKVLNLQAGSIAAVTGITMNAGGGDIDMQGGNCDNLARVRGAAAADLAIGTNGSDIAKVTSGGAFQSLYARIEGRTAINNTHSPYTVAWFDHWILVDTSGGAVTINLPAAASSTGRVLVIQDKGSAGGGNTITLDGNAAEKVNGAATKVISTNYEQFTLICDGADWYGG
jgi:hypothetical protein